VVKDVEPHEFIAAYAAYLKKAGKIELPKYVDVIKLGCFKEQAPTDPDWYYTRCAAIARRVYIYPTTGVGGFRKVFGGNDRRGVRPGHFIKSSGGIIRHCLQQLEKMGIVEIAPHGGRVMTKEGRRDLDRIAQQVLYPELFQ
jgi:small subunit ribosomal protein S19e